MSDRRRRNDVEKVTVGVRSLRCIEQVLIVFVKRLTSIPAAVTSEGAERLSQRLTQGFVTTLDETHDC